jgi:Tfp pilus assembly protein PilV
MHKFNNNNIFGFSILEVLIAVFILSFGLLGIAGLYISSLKRTENACWRALAVSQWIAMSEQQNDCLDWNQECQQLLPQGECKCEAGKITVCWRDKTGKQCL